MGILTVTGNVLRSLLTGKRRPCWKCGRLSRMPAIYSGYWLCGRCKLFEEQEV